MNHRNTGDRRGHLRGIARSPILEPMAATARITDFGELCARAAELANQGGRRLLGITGAPGAGKSTLAEAIVDRVGGGARLVGVDGFHLSQARLAELGRLDRKGAIDTFDGSGFVTLLRRLRAWGEETVYAPEFRREFEESIACAQAIEPHIRLLVVEGNYLLVPEPPWGELRTLLDEVWYCERDEGARIADLIARHRRYGKSDEAARRWARGTDQRNADLIRTTRSRADVVVALNEDPTEPLERAADGL
jgi:pantothenate kinase